MQSHKQEIAFSNRYLYYYASLIKKLYGFVIKRGDNQPDERYVGHLGEQPQRQELSLDAPSYHTVQPKREGVPEINEIVLFRFRKRLLLGRCRELLTRQVSEIGVQTEDGRHVRFHKTNLIYLTGITTKNDDQELYHYAHTIRTLSQHIELQTIWELAAESQTALTLEDIADLYWADEKIDATRYLSLYLYLNQNCPYFTSYQNTYIPTTQEEIDQRLQLQTSRKQQADEREEFIAYLQDDQDVETQTLTKHQQTWLEAIRQYALWGQEAKRAQEARAILSQVNPQTKNFKKLAFDCLVQKNVWEPHEILDLHRAEIPTSFTPQEQKEAQTLFAIPTAQHRNHKQRSVFLIQDPHIPQVALSYRKPLFSGPEFCLYIPDLSALVPHQSLCDQAALHRLQSLSLPQKHLPLFPQTVSFSTDRAIPTLSLIWKMDRKGRLKSFAVKPSSTTLQTVLSANEIDRAYHNKAHIHHRAITFFHHLAHRLQTRRTPRDPDFNLPDLHIVTHNQNPKIEPIPNQLAHHIIHELSILSGVAIGRWCHENGVPAIYETRDEVENINTLKDIENPMVRRHEIRRITPPIKKSEQFGSHHGLGVSIYCPIIDPQNHYAHLVMQRQIVHQLQHGKSFYTNEDLNTLRYQIQDMFAITNGIVYRQQREILLQMWEHETGATFEATVLHIKRHGVLVELRHAPFKTIVYPNHSVEVGERVTLRLTGINREHMQTHFTVITPSVTTSH